MPPFFSGPFEDTGRRQSLIYLRWLKNLLFRFSHDAASNDGQAKSTHSKLVEWFVGKLLSHAS